MYQVITIEREYGCGGGEIAAELARRLGWKLWDHALTEEIAKLANVQTEVVKRCEERVDTGFQRLVKVFLRGSYEHSMPSSGHDPFNTDRFVEVGQQAMEKVATTGKSVIVGRGAPYFLRGRGDTFHVFLYASHPEKMRRLKNLGKSTQEAETEIDAIDRERIEFVKRYFGADWPTRCLYHMMINTAIGNETVIETILGTMQGMEKQAIAPPVSCDPPHSVLRR